MKGIMDKRCVRLPAGASGPGLKPGAVHGRRQGGGEGSGGNVANDG